MNSEIIDRMRREENHRNDLAEIARQDALAAKTKINSRTAILDAADAADDTQQALLDAASDAGPLVGLLVIDLVRDVTTLAQRIRHVADALAAEEKERAK